MNRGGDGSLLVNAIVGKNNISMVECWKIEPGFQVSNVVRISLSSTLSSIDLHYNQTGTVGDMVLPLGSIDDAVYIIIPDDDGKPNNGGYVLSLVLE